MSTHLTPCVRPRLGWLALAAGALVGLSGCGTLPDSLYLTRQNATPAPVTAADIKPLSAVPPAATLGKAPLAVEEARNSNAPSVISRPLPAGQIGALQRGEASRITPGANSTMAATTRPVDGDGREAVGAPTDPLRPDTTLNLDDRDASADLWARMRKGFALPELSSDLVADHERWYASRPDYVARMMERANRYLFHVVEEVERRQMPAELALLPFIESAFNPQAMSSARASGIWQFMPATGKDFELKQNLFRDDRRDVLASTRAAMDYLQRLHRQFGDWHLALAAYNWGEGNVQRAINRNQKAGLPTDYLSLNMPLETRNYVPKLHAVRNIVAQPEAYGLSLPAIENHPYFVSVPIQRDMDVAVAARLAQLPMADFQALNPSMNKPVILAAGTPQVLLPYNNAALFIQNLGKHRGPLATLTAWVVPRTMRPAEAARQAGMSENELRELNRIPQRMLVKAGSTLLVPRPHQREQDVSESVADNAMMSLAPDLPPMRRLVIRAGKRDTVASIAKRYRVTPGQVAQWNKVAATGRFKRAQSVVVYVPVKAAGRAVAQRGARGSVRQAAASVRSNRQEARSKGSARSRVVAAPAKSRAKVVASKRVAPASRQASTKGNKPQGKVRVAAAADH